MNVKDTARRQYLRIVGKAATSAAGIPATNEGWLVSFRKALGMSGTQVAKRMGVTRNAVYQAERNELKGAITLNQMRRLAEAMGGRLVYTVVPDAPVEDMIRNQARRKARAQIGRAGTHMALEGQALPVEELDRRAEILADQLIRDMPSDLWEEK